MFEISTTLKLNTLVYLRMGSKDNYQSFISNLSQAQLINLQNQATLIKDSYERLTGKPYFDEDTENALLSMWTAPWVQLSHGTEDDPIFNFANETALALFEMDFDEFTQLPSRFSAEPVHRDERTRLLHKVNTQGYIDDYAGIRISKGGKRFKISNATVFNLIDEFNMHKGQAARFSDYIELVDK